MMRVLPVVLLALSGQHVSAFSPISMPHTSSALYSMPQPDSPATGAPPAGVPPPPGPGIPPPMPPQAGAMPPPAAPTAPPPAGSAPAATGQAPSPRRFTAAAYNTWWDNPGNHDPRKATTSGYFETFTDAQRAQAIGIPNSGYLEPRGAPIPPITKSQVPPSSPSETWWDNAGYHDVAKATTQGYFRTFTDQQVEVSRGSKPVDTGLATWWDNPGNHDPSKATGAGYFQTHTDVQAAQSRGMTNHRIFSDQRPSESQG